MENIGKSLKGITKGLEGLADGLNDAMKDVKGNLSEDELRTLNATMKEFDPKSKLTEMTSRINKLKDLHNKIKS